MFLNPQKVYAEGYITSTESNYPIDERQIQQVGIDLRVKNILQIKGSLQVSVENKILPSYVPLRLNKNTWNLNPGAYCIDMFEHVSIPEDCAAFVIHRSTFNSSGIVITGSTYDAGFQGTVGATMYAFTPLAIEIGSRVAQMIFIKGESASLYEGSYQDKKDHQERGDSVNENKV